MPSIRLLRAFSLAAVGCAAATAFADDPVLTYKALGPERVLLVNDDTRTDAPMSEQGYFDLEGGSTGNTGYYWYHDTASKPASGSAYTRLNLMAGINHKYYRRAGQDETSDTALWVLTQCRVGSAADSASTRCYIPWSNTCQPIDSTCDSAPLKATYTSGSQKARLTGMRQVATVVMRCSTDAQILSPSYEEGVGDIYFDAVNGFTANADSICLEVARSTTGGNELQEDTLSDDYKWEAWPCDVYEVRRQAGTLTLPEGNQGLTTIRLASKTSGGNLFYRIHAKVDCRTRTQFRIRRLTVSAGRNAPDYSALILVDNVVASYPNSTVEPGMYGDYDSLLTGKQALGWGGSFSVPFPSAYATNVQPRLKFDVKTLDYPESLDVTNYVKAANAKFHWRWRYLNQVVGDWEELASDETAEFPKGVGPGGFTWPALAATTNGPGDVEFYYTYDVTGTHYLPVDYAFSEGSEIGHGDDAYALETKTLREEGKEATASLGTEMFTRLREGASDWESFRAVFQVEDENGNTNNTYSSDVEMELVSDHTWRGFIPTPRGMAEAMEDDGVMWYGKFRVIGYNKQTAGSTGSYASNSNVWYAGYMASGAIDAEDLPYNGFATTNDFGTKVEVDALTAYLVLEFNDEHASYTIMHASYQNFNTWTDAAYDGGFVGNNAQTSGVSGVKHTYLEDFVDYALSKPSSGYWWENFDAIVGAGGTYPFDVEKESTTTPNNWIGLNGCFVNGTWVSQTNASTTAKSGGAWQMKGNSAGGVEFSNTSALPNGIDTVSFTARLAQPISFDDFAYSFRSLTETNYAVLAKAVLTAKGTKTVDYAQHQPSISLVAYYRPGKGCYELRMSLVYSDVVQLEIYRWSPVGTAMKPTLLTSCRYSSNHNSWWRWDGNYYNTLGTCIRMYPACWDGTAGQPVDNPGNNQSSLFSGCAWIQNHHLCPTDAVDGEASETWPSVYFGVYNGKGSADQDVTYLEGGFSGKVTGYNPEKDMESKLFTAISFEDSADSRHTRGSFGVGSRDCPARFGLIKKARTTAKGRWYKNTGIDLDSAALTASETEIAYDLGDDNWTAPLGRQTTFSYDKVSSGYNFYYGVQSTVPDQTVRLLFRRLNSQQWVESGYDTAMLKPDGTFYPTLQFSKNSYSFSPRDCDVNMFRLMTSGGTDDMRTDVVIDDIKFTQWAGGSVINEKDDTATQLQKWAYLRGWISGATNVVAASEGTTAGEDDDNAYIVGHCQATYTLGSEIVYVFTNNATFIPKADMQIVEALVVGGGGAGGSAIGGGGGGGLVVDYKPGGKYIVAGEQLDIVVGAGGAPQAGCAWWKGDHYDYYQAGGWPNWWTRGGSGEKSELRYTAFDKDRVTLVTAYGGGGGGAGAPSSATARHPGQGWTQGTPVGGGGGSAYKDETHAIGMIERSRIGNTSNYFTNNLAACGGAADTSTHAPGGGGAGWYGAVTGTDPDTGREIRAGDGYDGDPSNAGGQGGEGYESYITGFSQIFGSGGGGGAGVYTNGLYSSNVETPGNGGTNAGNGGNGKSGKGKTAIEVTENYGAGHPGTDGFGGGGGGGGAWNATDVEGQGRWDNERWDNGNNQSRGGQWGASGGRGGCGTVILRVRPSSRYCMLQPMRGFANEPMSVRSPNLNGLSMFAFTWRNADENARLFVQIATNDVTGSTIAALTQSMDYDEEGSSWHTVDVIDFSDVPAGQREYGSTNYYFGLRAPYYSGIFRVMVDPARVTEAVANRATYDANWGGITLTRVQAWDEPALTPYDWWGWNLRTAYNSRLMYLPDASYDPQGLACTLNYSGSKYDVGDADNDPEFSTKYDVDDAMWGLHDPFVQTPVMANAGDVGNIGQVTFRARKYGAITQTTSSWVRVSVAENASALDKDWVTVTNFEVTGNTFQKFTWRMLNDEKNYAALRLSVADAKNGRVQDDGLPIQRVLIDEVAVTEPMLPKLAVQQIGTFRHHLDDDVALAPEVLLSPDEQPLAGESFGVQATVAVQQLEDELDKDSIEVWLSYYTGTSPWGYENWKTKSSAVLNVKLPRSSDNEFVFRSSPSDTGSFVPPQQLDEKNGFTVLQYQITVTYRDKAGNALSSTATISDWDVPEWYHPLDYNKQYGQNTAAKFSIYTILDTISPRRAWVNEITYLDGFVTTASGQSAAVGSTNQWVELAVPQGYDLSNWKLYLAGNVSTPTLKILATLGAKGGDNKVISSSRSAYPEENYSFLAIQSPATATAKTLASDLVEGTWNKTTLDPLLKSGGVLDQQYPGAFRLVRANGIIEHEVVFMATNRGTARTSWKQEGTNFLVQLQKSTSLNGNWFFAGHDATDGSLGVYTNHGESASVWAEDMVQTPGKVNMFRSGKKQYIDPGYFEPPTGTNLWLYASVGENSQDYVSMTVDGKTGQKTAVIIVPQAIDGTYSASVTYVLEPWFEMKSITTNGVAITEGVEGQSGTYVFNIDGITFPAEEKKTLTVVGDAQISSKVRNAGISTDDPYYPAVVDWIMDRPEADIHRAAFVGLNGQTNRLMSIREMYWLNIDPTESNWVFCAGIGSKPTAVDPTPPEAIRTVQYSNKVSGVWVPYTNVIMRMTMYMTNTTTHEVHAPDRLLGLEPGSDSHDYVAGVTPNWTSETFKVTGALQTHIGTSDSTYLPLRTFVFGPDSFDENFSCEIEILDPHQVTSPTYVNHWFNYPWADVFYMWTIDTATIPVKTEMLMTNSTYGVRSN